jgi:hypothetical protein
VFHRANVVVFRQRTLERCQIVMICPATEPGEFAVLENLLLGFGRRVDLCWEWHRVSKVGLTEGLKDNGHKTKADDRDKSLNQVWYAVLKQESHHA